MCTCARAHAGGDNSVELLLDVRLQHETITDNNAVTDAGATQIIICDDHRVVAARHDFNFTSRVKQFTIPFTNEAILQIDRPIMAAAAAAAVAAGSGMCDVLAALWLVCNTKEIRSRYMRCCSSNGRLINGVNEDDDDDDEHHRQT